MRTLTKALGNLRTAAHYMGSRRNGGADRRGNRPIHRRNLRVESLEERTLLNAGGSPDLKTSYLLPSHNLFQSGGYLSEPSTGAPLDIAMSYLTSHADLLGLSPADVSHSIVTDQYTSSDTGMTHIYLRQQFNGLPVANANMNINVAADGRVLNVGGGFVAGLAEQEQSQIAPLAAPLPTLAAPTVLHQIAAKLGLTSQATALAVFDEPNDVARSTTLCDAALSLDSIPAKLQYVATERGVQLAWNYVLRTPDGDHWYDVSADGSTADVLLLSDWIDEASYTVFALPTENPNDGSRTTVVDPANATASPYGWHDTNGAAGAEYTDTRGNNVDAHDDWDANNSGGARPSGGSSLVFDFPIDYTKDPHTYVSAATTNLFYWNNIVHDVHYVYGFTEVAGNFQQNNYGNGGAGGDAVQADCQDGEGMNNANFGTPPDGSKPRMQMYEFDYTSPDRDGDLESMIMVHEYGHGVSNRVVGGPSNVNALDAMQSGGMGEGWSDWWGLMLTQKPTDTKTAAYPVGNYVIGESQTGGGIRRYPYSFSMGIDPLTYGDFTASPEVHDAGEIWCSALWDMTWLLIDAHGYSSDISHGYDPAVSGRNAGNNLALQLVMDSLAIMPANPTFLDGRDALLLADQALTGGANATAIWTAFARRGMGFSAYDGGDANATTVAEAFDLPPVDPMILSHGPTGSTSTAINYLQYSFSEAIDPASFTVADDVARFTGPGGADLKGQITGATWVNNKTLRVNFNSQSAIGAYSMVLGPQILAADNHNPMDQDRDGTRGEVPGDQYTATVTVLSRFFSQSMDANPNWTVSGGQWAFGHPTGNGGTVYGNPDPTGGYTGSNVYGVNLNGDYNTAVGGPYYLTTPSIDCSDYSSVTLDLQRWLNTDWGSYVSATIDVWDGTAWHNVYSSPAYSTVEDSAWQHLTYPIGAYADGKSAVKIRWGYQVLEDFAVFQMSGWNIDDVGLAGIPLGPDVKGPSVTAQYPAGTVDAGQSALQFSFSEPMDTASFSVADDVVSFTGPSGDLKPQVIDYSWIDSQTLEVRFTSQGTSGTYTMVIGPNISDDAPSFNPMNQDGNAINGEIPGDQYTGTFEITNALYFASMDSDPGWTLDAGSAPYQWQYGVPAGADGDPVSGHTRSKVVGYNLDGTYPDNMSATQYATTPAFSTLGYTDVKLSFWRWLGVETSSYDHANIQVWDGSEWKTLWNHSSGTLTESSWSRQQYTLPASACNKPEVKIRWGMGPTDNSMTYCGWNIDDVAVAGTPVVGNGEIQGDKWNDLDGDGARDAGEPTLAGWTIYIDSNSNGALDAGEPSQVTDASGHYRFANVTPGTYCVREVMQSGWRQTSPAVVSQRLFDVRVSGSTATIYELDPTTGAMINSFPVPAAVTGGGPQGLALGLESLFYVDGSTSPHTLWELNPDTGAVIDSDVVDASAPSEIAGVGYLNGKVYLEQDNLNKILVWDPASDTLVTTLTLSVDVIGGLTGAADLGVLFDSSAQGQIFKIDPATGAVLATLTPGVGRLVGGLAYVNNELLACDFLPSPTIYRFNPNTGATLGTITPAGAGSLAALGGDGIGSDGSLTVIVATGQVVVGIDFGNRLIQTTGRIEGDKWNDLDGDGVRDAGEPTLAGWTIYLDANNSGTLDAGEPSQVTDDAGHYVFADVPPGTYAVREVAQSGWTQTYPSASSNGSRLFELRFMGAGSAGTICEVDPTTGAVLHSFATPALIAGDGPQGLALGANSLFYIDGSTSGPHTLWELNPDTGAVIDSDVVDAANPVSFDGLAYLNGKVYLQEWLADTILVWDPTLDVQVTTMTVLGVYGGLAGASDRGVLYATTNPGQILKINPTTGAVLATFSPGLGFLTGLAYVNGALIGALPTGAAYRFDPETGAVLGNLTIGGTGTLTALGGDGAGGIGAHVVVIAAGQVVAGADFGNHWAPTNGRIEGDKWNDLDGDGVRDAGEPTLAGWTIYLDTNSSGTLDDGEPSKVTDAGGHYVFADLPAGTYTVREVAQSGWTQTYPIAGNNGSRLFELRVTSAGVAGTICEVDPTTGAVLHSFATPAPISTLGPQGLALGTNSLFYIDGSASGSHTLWELNPETGAVIDSDVVDAASPRMIDGLGFLNGKVYLQRGDNNAILVWDPVLDVQVTTLTVPGVYGGLTGASDLEVLFATAGQNQIVKVDPATGAVLATFTTSVGTVLGLAYVNGELIAALPLGTAYRLDPNTGTVLGNLTLGGTGFVFALGGDGVSGNAAHTVVLAESQVATGIDFGNHVVPTTGRIEGDKWNDLDADGVRDAGEPTLAGWTIYLDSDNDGVFDAGEPSQVTDSAGHYVFADLPPGTYTVREVMQTGWQQTSPVVGGQRLFDVRASVTTATIYELDPATGAVINSFAAPATLVASGPQGLALGPNSLFYIDGSFQGPHTLWELDPNTGAVIDSDVVDATAPTEIAGLGYLNGKVYLEQDQLNKILVWDPISDTVVTTLTLSVDVMGGLTGAADLGVLFDSNAQGRIYKIDPATGAVLATLTPGVGTFNGGLAYVNNELLACGYSPSPTIYRVDPTTGASLGTIAPAGTGFLSALGGDGIAANGAHTVLVVAGQTATGKDFGNFHDVTAPTATIDAVAPTPRLTPVASIAIHFSEPVVGFGIEDLQLALGSAGVSLNGATLVSTDQQNWTLGNLSGITSALGDYQLTLAAAGSGIADIVGNPLTAGAVIAWRTVAPLAGDFNLDQTVNQLDLAIWMAHVGMMTGATFAMGDANHDGAVNLLDLDLWKATVGQVQVLSNPPVRNKVPPAPRPTTPTLPAPLPTRANPAVPSVPVGAPAGSVAGGGVSIPLAVLPPISAGGGQAVGVGNSQPTATVQAAPALPRSLAAKSGVSAADSLANVALPAGTLQAAHDALFSRGSLVDGLLADAKADSGVGLKASVNLGRVGIPKTSLS